MDSTDKILVLFPTRQRVSLAQRALDSWKKNSIASDIIMCFQEDDPSLEDYKKMASDLPYIIRANIGLANKANELIAARTKKYAGYMILNDDQIIQTPNWDRIILDRISGLQRDRGHRIWIPHWRDGIQDQRLCQGFVTDQMLEYFEGKFCIVKNLRHECIDDVFMHIGKSIGCLVYLPQVFIEHLHHSVGKSEYDANYKETQNGESYKRASAALAVWKATEAPGLINRLRIAISSR